MLLTDEEHAELERLVKQFGGYSMYRNQECSCSVYGVTVHRELVEED